MSTATAEYLCEVCKTPLVYRGGPHKPRWCDKHRLSEKHKADRKRQAAYENKAKPVGRRVHCVEPDCGTVLLTPVPSGRCGFCLVELGYATEQDLLSVSADLCVSMDS